MFADLLLPAASMIFAVATLVIAIGATHLTTIADRLADRTGLGEATVGGILLGASTSLSGTVTSVTAAHNGHPDLAVSNALGGIAAQTAFLAIADLTYRRANLEHAAASLTNLNQATILVAMLSLPLVALSTPPVTVLGVHPVSILLVIVYVLSIRLVRMAHNEPMWAPVETSETRADLEEDEIRSASLSRMAIHFVILAIVIALAGWLLSVSGVQIAHRTGIGETVVGALMTAVATSLPELITTLAAVRRGALQLAVGGIVGGNTFDVLFLVPADAVFTSGSIYHAANPQYGFWIAVSLLMSAVLLLGLLRREKYGIGNIGFESALLIGIYAGAVVIGVVGLG